MATKPKSKELSRLSQSILGFVWAGGGELTLSTICRQAWRAEADDRSDAIQALIDGGYVRRSTRVQVDKHGPDPVIIKILQPGKRLVGALRAA